MAKKIKKKNIKKIILILILLVVIITVSYIAITSKNSENNDNQNKTETSETIPNEENNKEEEQASEENKKPEEEKKEELKPVDDKKEEQKPTEDKKEETKKEEVEKTEEKPIVNEKPIDENTIKSLENLNYSSEDISNIKKYVSTKNINYLVDYKIDNKIAMDFINARYYIDDYLQKYINYQKLNQKKTTNEIITIINTHIDSPFYTNTIKTDTTKGKYVILNKYYHADSGYPSQKLINGDTKYHVFGNKFMLTQECYDAFLKMYNDAKSAGYEFKIKSAYRSYKNQVSTYNYWVKTENGNKAKADTYSARAGYSEHQTGYAFDVRDYPLTNDDFGKTKSFTWVSQNAHKYGFFLRFPKGKEYITGYQYESWHFRYCGVECATYIYNNNITYEEYYEYFIKYGNPKNLS